MPEVLHLVKAFGIFMGGEDGGDERYSSFGFFRSFQNEYPTAARSSRRIVNELRDET